MRLNGLNSRKSIGTDMDKTILAIDDEKSMLAFYAVALAEFGIVRTAENLHDARMQLDGVDLIVLDFNLEHDLERFQDIVPELKKTAPVLLCSGIQELEVPVMGVGLGIAGYWNKGSDHEMLRSLVRSILKPGTAAAQLNTGFNVRKPRGSTE